MFWRVVRAVPGVSGQLRLVEGGGGGGGGKRIQWICKRRGKSECNGSIKQTKLGERV